MTYINLKKQFGGRWKVSYEPSYHAEHGPRARVDDPWLHQIECVNGTICPWGAEKLAACTKTRGPVSNRLAALGCVTVVQDGSDGITATFHAKDIETVAEVMKPRLRRRGRKMSEEEKDKLADMGRKALADLRTGRGATSQAPDNAHSRHFSPWGVTEVTQDEEKRFKDAKTQSTGTTAC